MKIRAKILTLTISITSILILILFSTIIIKTKIELKINLDKTERMVIKQKTEFLEKLTELSYNYIKNEYLYTDNNMETVVAGLKNMTYDVNGYFFVISKEEYPIMIYHPNKDLVGITLTNEKYNIAVPFDKDRKFTDLIRDETYIKKLKTKTGANIFKLLVNEVIKSKEKYEAKIIYSWQKEEIKTRNAYGEVTTIDQTLYPKLTFARSFEPWEIIIGTGIYIDDIIKNIDELKREAEEKTKKYIIIVSLLSILIETIIILISIYFSKTLTNSIIKLKEYIKKISTGDLSSTIKLISKDEIGEMTTAVNNLVIELNSILTETDTLSENVAAQSRITEHIMDNILKGKRSNTFKEVDNYIEKGIEDLQEFVNIISDNVRDQTASTEETLAGMQEISASGEALKEHSDKILDISKKVVLFSKKNNEKITNMIDKIKDIKNNVSMAEGNFEILIELTKEIESILSGINDISEQTNLLALNAAIEAARAGDAGRGFSVVADEIRKLANRTDKEVDKISALMSNIISSINNVQNSNKNVRTSIEDGIEITEEVVKGTNNSIAAIEENDDSIQQINITIEEEKLAINEITIAVCRITESSTEIEEVSMNTNQISKEISTMLNKLFEGTKKLSKAAYDLKLKIDFFKL